MNHHDFVINQEFQMSGKSWLCTDIGKRTIIAICITGIKDKSYLNGPPYALVEIVIDENDFSVCEDCPF